MPFPIRAVQVDGGSEFQAEFEQECHRRKLALYVLPPRSPKLNGAVERAQRTHTEEFYQIYDGDMAMGPLNAALREWERVYNHVRPHQALGYLTPGQFLAQRAASQEEPAGPGKQQAAVVSSGSTKAVHSSFRKEDVYGIT